MPEASSFGTAAPAYAEHRPGYAPAAVRWALETAPGPRVLDLGAGTGKLTAGLAALTAGLARVAGPAVIGPRDTPAAWRAEIAGRFGGAEIRDFAHGQTRTADSLVATLATRAGVLVMPEPEREATLARIRVYLVDRPDGTFTLPMRTCVLRTACWRDGS